MSGYGHLLAPTRSAPPRIHRGTTTLTHLRGALRRIQLYIRPGPGLRLTHRPLPFERERVARTTGVGEYAAVEGRLGRAWVSSIASGPVWELIEDRGWWKEVQGSLGMDGLEKIGGEELAKLWARPIVYGDVEFPQGWTILSRAEATPFLPCVISASPDKTITPPPPLSCSFGPFGNQKRVDLSMFETLQMDELFQDSKAHVLNAGGPVWGLDWCPVTTEFSAESDHTQYLAVATFPSFAHTPTTSSRLDRPAKAGIQIWSYGPSGSVAEGKVDVGKARCEMVLCIESGPANELKWCPMPSHDPLISGESDGPRKLGIVAGVFGDGSLSFYAVPHPSSIRHLQTDPEGPIFVHFPEPLLRIEIPEAGFVCLDWGNSELVAVGCTNGLVIFYLDRTRLFPLIAHRADRLNCAILPNHYISVHQSLVRSVAWVRAPPFDAQGLPLTECDPTTIASASYDGCLIMTDLRELGGFSLFRVRDLVTSVAYCSYAGSVVSADHENLIKSYAVAPLVFGKGHSVLQTRGPSWDISVSDFHPYVATASSDGTCSTSNSYKSPRKRGIVAKFIHTIYHIDYKRKTGEYRMLENFFPRVQPRRRPRLSPPSQAQLRSQPAPSLAEGSGSWPVEVGVHRVAWHNGAGMARSPLLASGTACGLVRIDWLEGRFFCDRMPYTNVQILRGEEGGAVAMDEDEEDSDSDEED
ncbi:hypothetical protein BOTBODRAFT_115064 [Botryobasidium botryosum FD-172 SS1]|uniref:Uncharacterized protein n=1 Tax=Botryobasidium botryosum (strain FD-172 SS1) TaxID=930990 RepID=A0A067MGG8_BOTB1|nr:hypothetical protein BOTBODRAFT_115064 [Botryobasidium botryosum FD-172 SS1]